MSQISPPLRIALVAAIAFVGVWALFLRPAAPEPVVTDPAVEAATATGDTAAAPVQSIPATTPSTGTATGPAVETTAAPSRPSREAMAELPRDVARAVRREKVVALLFWNPEAADDRRVRRSLSAIGSYDGRVFVKAARVGDIARYAPITRGADVQQAPTLVVVDSDLRAESLVGFVARGTIRQALSDAVRASR